MKDSERLKLIATGLLYENVTTPKTRSAGKAIAEIAARLDASPVCSITGNPCGTDTWAKGNPPDCHCGRMHRELDAPRNEVASLSIKLDLLPLAEFGRWCITELREGFGDLDGGSAQDAMEELGLLANVTVTEPCGENCRCVEYYGTDCFPVECLRETDAAKALGTGG